MTVLGSHVELMFSLCLILTLWLPNHPVLLFVIYFSLITLYCVVPTGISGSTK